MTRADYLRQQEVLIAAHRRLVELWKALEERTGLQPPAELCADLVAVGGFDTEEFPPFTHTGMAPDPVSNGPPSPERAG
jgi:hypothetical protein